jgi:hypothetical protein
VGGKGYDVAVADTFYLGGGPFEALRIVVDAVDDDQILKPAADEELAFLVEVAEASGLEPAIGLEGLLRLLGVLAGLRMDNPELMAF